jgi:hypothetical protein
MRPFLFSLLLVLPLTAAEKHPWASFKPGSYAKLRTTTVTGPTKIVSEMKQTLVSVDANQAVIETEMSAMGQVTKTKSTIPLKAAAAAGTAQGKPVTPVKETITAAGKSIACQCVDMTTEANGMKSTTHACTSESVPGGAVRLTMRMTGAMKSESVTELVEYAAK